MEIEWNCILSPINFLINLSSMFKSTIGQNNLGESYNDLLGLEIMINIDMLKCKDQYPRFIQVLAMLIIESRHGSLLIIHLKCF